MQVLDVLRTPIISQAPSLTRLCSYVVGGCGSTGMELSFEGGN
jgi:hypothetical protein